MPYAAETLNISMAPYVLMLSAILMTCIAVIFMAAVMDSDTENGLVRGWQYAALSTTRMRRMIRRRGIPLWDYLGAFAVPELREQRARCRECSQHELCDQALASAKLSGHATFSFCPNRPTIERFRSARQVPGEGTPRPA